MTMDAIGEPTILDLSTFTDPLTCSADSLTFSWDLYDTQGNHIRPRGMLEVDKLVMRLAANSLPNGWHEFRCTITRPSGRLYDGRRDAHAGRGLGRVASDDPVRPAHDHRLAMRVRSFHQASGFLTAPIRPRSNAATAAGERARRSPYPAAPPLSCR